MAITREDLAQYICGSLGLPRNKLIFIDDFDTDIARHVCMNTEKINLLYREFLNIPMPDGTKITVQYYLCRDCGKLMVLRGSLETFTSYNKMETDYWRYNTGIIRGNMGSYGGYGNIAEGGYVPIQQNPQQDQYGMQGGYSQQGMYNQGGYPQQDMYGNQGGYGQQNMYGYQGNMYGQQDMYGQQGQYGIQGGMNPQQGQKIQFDEYGNPIMSDGNSYW